MGKRAHSDADIRGSRGHRVRRPNKGTLWERAQYADAQLPNFQEEMARQSEQNCELICY
jgi:hypothetical protein